MSTPVSPSPRERIRRAGKELRAPNPARWYGAADPRSWSALSLVKRRLHASPSELRRAASIVRRARRDGRFLATLPRSGTNWLVAMIESAINLDHGLDGDYDLVQNYWVSGDPGWAPRGGRHHWPNSLLSVVHASCQTTQRPPDPIILGAHFPVTSGTTDLGATGRPVVLVRDPFDAIDSQLHKDGRTGRASADHATALVNNYVRFYEYWHDLSRRRGDDVLVLRFEDLTHDPEHEVQKVSEHWNLGLSDSAVVGAVRLCDRKRMADKASSDPTNVRITIDDPSADEALIDPVHGLLRERLDTPLGYDLRRPGT